MMENAKAFSDTAMVVITRVGGEGADLPTDMASVVDGSWIRRVAQAYGSERGTTYYNGTYDDSLNEGNDWDKATTSCSCPTVRKTCSTWSPQTSTTSFWSTTAPTPSRWTS